jgi:hypothetical protein
MITLPIIFQFFCKANPAEGIQTTIPTLVEAQAVFAFLGEQLTPAAFIDAMHAIDPERVVYAIELIKLCVGGIS